MQNRPAVKLIIPYLVGILLANRFNLNLAFLWIISALLIASAFITYRRRFITTSSILITLLFLITGFLRYEMAMIPPPGLEKIQDKQVKVVGTVLECSEESNGGSSLTLK
jgi:hypothetical protein